MLNTNNARKSWIALSWVLVLTLLLSSCGQVEQAKVYHVGVLSGLDYFAPALEGFKTKMTELGYVEGENITYDVQSTNVDMEAYTDIAAKFVEDDVDLIFVFPTEAAAVAKAATQGTDVPVVFDLAFTDVKGIDLINSVREPGGNITGVRFPSVDIASQRLQILLELAPQAKRVFVPFLKDYPNVPGQLEALSAQAQSSGVELIEFGATSPQELQAEVDSFVTADGVNIDAILLIAEPLGITPPFYDVLGTFAYDHKLPIGGALVETNGNSSVFGLLPQANVTGEQAAILADKVLTGTPAGSIPVVTADGYFQINYKAAQALGVTIPDGLLKRADEIIR